MEPMTSAEKADLLEQASHAARKMAAELDCQREALRRHSASAGGEDRVVAVVQAAQRVAEICRNGASECSGSSIRRSS